MTELIAPTDERLLLLGDEAIACAALDAGISGAYAYPGTPSTEILEFVQRSEEAAARGVHRQWSANEKTAMEEALGMSYSGKRAMVSMKHVGLNVAADAFINSAITGVNGGLLVVVADDPSMHSSQNEQDSRFYAKFAQVPLLEPSDQQEAYDMVVEGFDLSEELNLPVVIRITTRLAHSRAAVQRQAQRAENKISLPSDNRQFVLLPANARRNYAELLEKQTILRSRSEGSRFNRIQDGPDRNLGIITTGIALNYVLENYGDQPCPHPLLKVGQYPLPGGLIRKLFDQCEKLLVVEEGYPFAEDILRGLFEERRKIRGRLDGTLPLAGELSPAVVGKALGFDTKPAFDTPQVVAPRPPSMCRGCPHIDTYKFLNEALTHYDRGRVFSDIGCYTLGALPPFESINSCVDMGASITMAKGAADAGIHPSIAVIGDSTFTHSGMTGVLDAVYEGTNVTIVILDNETVAMTGTQESLGAGKMEHIVEGLGVDPKHIRTVVPHPGKHNQNVSTLREELDFEGVSVVVSRRVCVQAIRRRV